jgi:mono/diheme cytochrome c family protein
VRDLFALFLAALALSACDQMALQPREHVYKRSPLFANGMSMQTPPEGVIARGDLEAGAELDTRPQLTPALLQRGQDRYMIYCAVCHDAAGYGDGIVPSRGFPRPPSFHTTRLRQATSRHFVDVITNGYGVMYAYRDRVPPDDRWAIAAYIRALQLSQATPKAQLTPAQLAAVETGHGG